MMKFFLSFALFFSNSFAFSSTQLAKRRVLDYSYEAGDFKKTEAWFNGVWDQGKKNNLSDEEFYSPKVFEISLVKSLASLSLPKPIIDLESLPEFMTPQKYAVRNISLSLETHVESACAMAGFEHLLKEHGLSLSEVSVKIFRDIAMMADEKSFIPQLVTKIYFLLNKEQQKTFDLSYHLKTLKQVRFSPHMKKLMEKRLFSYLEQFLRQGKIPKEKEGRVGYFYMDDIKKSSEDIRYLIKIFTKRYEEKLYGMVLKSRFKRFHTFLRDKRELDKNLLSSLDVFEGGKLEDLNKKLNILCDWESYSYHFLILVSQKMVNQNRQMFLIEKINKIFLTIKRESFFDATDSQMKIFFSKVIDIFIEDKEFLEQATLSVEDLNLLQERISRSFFSIEGYSSYRKNSYLDNLSTLISSEKKYPIKISSCSNDHAKFLLDSFYRFFNLYFKKKERSSKNHFGLFKALPKARTGFKSF